MKRFGLFAAGVLFGTAGLKVLGSKDARKFYPQTTAAALRAKDCVMATVTTVRECADDIYADAKAINEQRAEAEAEAVVEDAAAEVARLRCSGCRVGAVFFGSSGNYPNAEKIYGRQLVRIRQMEEFSKAAVELIRMECEQ